MKCGPASGRGAHMRRYAKGTARVGGALLGGALSVLACSRPAPTCRHCSASYVSHQELDAFLARGQAQHLVDQQVRNVDVGKSHVAVGVVQRGPLAAPDPDSVAEHDQVTEVYHVLDGAGTLVTGPELVQPEPHEPDPGSGP